MSDGCFGFVVLRFSRGDARQQILGGICDLSLLVEIKDGSFLESQRSKFPGVRV